MAKTLKENTALNKNGIMNIKFEPFVKKLQAVDATQGPNVTEVMY